MLAKWTSKQHLWKSKAKGHQLSRDGPSNRQKKNDIKIAPLAVQSTLSYDYWPKVSLVLALKEKGKYPRVGTLLIYM